MEYALKRTVTSLRAKQQLSIFSPKARVRSSDHSTQLKTIDLFCGAGGITEGFRQAGMQCLYGNDVMAEAIQTFANNHRSAIADPGPIEKVDPAAIRARLRLARGELDVLVGGPPCQGFSINAPERFLSDPRNVLFKYFVRFLDEFKPKCFLFENVPGLISLGQGKIFDQIRKQLVSRGYAVSARVLFAPHYGVPQERWRLIILGSSSGEIEHPEPSHFAQGRANFTGGRTLTFPLSDVDKARLKPAVTVRDAIGDLPRLRMGEGAEEISYDKLAHSDFAVALRNPEGITYNHYAAQLSKQNAERMKYVKPGGSWRDIPHHLLPRGMQRAKRSDHTKRYGRLRSDGLAGTVMTKCDPHWGSVFLPNQDRTLTVREAARLQSFPDTYRFHGSRVSQYEQVGNAVPVLMAKAIAEAIRAHIQEYETVVQQRRARYG